MKITYLGQPIYTKQIKRKPLLDRLGITRGKIWAWVIAPALIATFVSTTISYATGAQIYRVDTVFIPKTVEVEKARGVGLEKLPPILQKICLAESDGIQYKNGTVLKGYTTPQDRGVCQINSEVWGKKAKELGYDLHTLEGNTDMALWIFENHGSVPWKASASRKNGSGWVQMSDSKLEKKLAQAVASNYSN